MSPSWLNDTFSWSFLSPMDTSCSVYVQCRYIDECLQPAKCTILLSKVFAKFELTARGIFVNIEPVLCTAVLEV